MQTPPSSVATEVTTTGPGGCDSDEQGRVVRRAVGRAGGTGGTAARAAGCAKRTEDKRQMKERGMEWQGRDGRNKAKKARRHDTNKHWGLLGLAGGSNGRVC